MDTRKRRSVSCTRTVQWEQFTLIISIFVFINHSVASLEPYTGIPEPNDPFSQQSFLFIFFSFIISIK